MKMLDKIRISSKLWAPAFTVLLLVSSCDLEIDETDSIKTKGSSDVFNGYTSTEAVDGLLTGIYNDLSGQVGDQANLYALQEVTTDELLVPTRGTDWGDNGVWRTLHQHTWSATHPYVLAVWNNANSAVLKTTQIIDPLSTGTSVLQRAEAKFARAYNMWTVMDFYGQVPFRQPTDGPSVVPSVMTRAEAYDFILQDLTEAIVDLPVGSATAASKARPTKATARFMLAKLKLNANIYKGAYGATDLDDVIALVGQIEADGYALVGDYFNIFKGPNYTNSDVIWNMPAGAGNRMWNGLHYNQQELIPNEPGASTNSGGGWNGFTTLAEFYDKFQGPPNTNTIGSGQEERRGYTQTLQSTNAQNEGFGFGFQLGQMYGWKDGAAVALKDRVGNPLVFTRELPGLIGNNELTGIRLLKYSPANGAFTNGVVMARFADAQLMRAEAMLRKGNTAGALAEVNELRLMRTNTPPLPTLTEAILLDERGRELYTEGWRRNDMIRFGAFRGTWQFKGDTEGGSTDGHTDLFPIPASALLSNPNLVQNPGY
jgi:starch-binding outer membrane protein, SusD/RagB family